MKKNSKIHLWLETDLKRSIEIQAKQEEISVCEFCRQRLRRILPLERLEEKINLLIVKTSDIEKYIKA